MKRKGLERQRRYNQLIDNSAQLVSLEVYEGSVYYQEPFYQLMRQTLWAEQVVKHKKSERIKADDFWHLHIVPPANDSLLACNYKVSGKGMEETWRSMLNDQSKYSIVDPEDLFLPLCAKTDYITLIEYLKARYW